MKAYTDLEQSKKLAEILPLESADMYWWSSGKRYYIEAIDDDDYDEDKDIRAWSLAALLEKLPYEVVDEEGTSRFFELYRGYMDKYYISYTGADEDIEGDYYDEIVDACVDMIIKLNELKML